MNIKIPRVWQTPISNIEVKFIDRKTSFPFHCHFFFAKCSSISSRFPLLMNSFPRSTFESQWFRYFYSLKGGFVVERPNKKLKKKKNNWWLVLLIRGCSSCALTKPRFWTRRRYCYSQIQFRYTTHFVATLRRRDNVVGNLVDGKERNEATS